MRQMSWVQGSRRRLLFGHSLEEILGSDGRGEIRYHNPEARELVNAFIPHWLRLSYAERLWILADVRRASIAIAGAKKRPRTTAHTATPFSPSDVGPVLRMGVAREIRSF